MTIPAQTRLDATFGALADPTRRAILIRLAKGEATVSDLASPFDMSLPAISKHLKVLERAGLVVVEKDAQRRPRKINAAPLKEAAAWIERYKKSGKAASIDWDDFFGRAQTKRTKRHGRDR